MLLERTCWKNNIRILFINPNIIVECFPEWGYFNIWTSVRLGVSHSNTSWKIVLLCDDWVTHRNHGSWTISNHLTLAGGRQGRRQPRNVTNHPVKDLTAHQILSPLTSTSACARWLHDRTSVFKLPHLHPRILKPGPLDPILHSSLSSTLIHAMLASVQFSI